MDHDSPVNWQPRSVTTVTGTPKREIQARRNPVLEEISWSSRISTQRVLRSIIVSKYLYPWEGGSGPTISTFTSVNLLVGMGISCSSGTVCRVTFEVWHCRHCLHQADISACIPAHNHLLVINLRVALVPGDQSSCGPRACMGQAVDGVEDSSAELFRNNRAWDAGRDVTDKFHIIKHHKTETEPF